MSNTWMVSIYKFNTSRAIELHYYLFLFFKLFDIISTLQFRKSFQMRNLLFLLAQCTNNSPRCKLEWNHDFNFKSLITHSQLKTRDNFLIIKPENAKLVTNDYYYNSYNKIKIYQKIFTLFTLFNFSLSHNQFRANPSSKLFYIKYMKKDLVILDTKKFFIRWKDTFDLIFSVFYYKFNPIVFGSPYFKNEILALNWNYNHFDINLWRYYFPFLIFKPNKYNAKVSYYFDKLTAADVDFFIISDCAYHYKMTYYIRKKKLYSIGLVSLNAEPWVVTYPIIGFFDSYVTQFFFFKLLISEEKKARFAYYLHFRKTWSFLLINLLNSSNQLN